MKRRTFLLAIMAALLGGCDEPADKRVRRCVRTEMQDVVTYPYMAPAMMGLLPKGMAFVPIIDQEAVCVAWEDVQ